ncbi:HAD family hydrolase [Neobacillus sp. NRS-1170]|uniref:HAD family hydrolase n=1 Tax=Neobacillus sp. NRS-1170 TaxID=3233898 RepID=UPI003D2B47FE
MVIKAIFFDLDDTLHDHLLPFSNALIATLPINYREIDVVSLYKKFRHFSDILWKSYSAKELTLKNLRINRIMLALESYDIRITIKQAVEFQNQYEHDSKKLHLFPDVTAVLKTIINYGLTLGIITNGPIEHQFKKIQSLGLTKYFNRDLIFISDEVGIAKPSPELFVHVAQRTGFAPNEHLYIGDTWSNDIAASSEAGWQSIWYNHRNRLPETNHKPLTIIEKLSSVLAVINEMDQKT